MELKGTYEKQEKGVLLEFQLVNTTGDVVEVHFPSGQQFEIDIIDEKGKEVYRYSEDRFFTMAVKTEQLAAGESLKWQDTWNYIDKNGVKRSQGNFKATVKIKAMAENLYQNSLMVIVNINL